MTKVDAPKPHFVPPRPSRRRASAYRDAQRALWQRQQVVRIAAIAALAVVVLVSVTGAAAAMGFASLPNADALVSEPLPSDTLVYDRTNQVLIADLHPPGYQHYQEPLSALGRYLPEATVAIEDANFWIEPGVDPLSILRAGLIDVRAHAVVEGGSTITQQLVKQRLVGNDQRLSRKFREAALAMRVSNDFSKTQILAMYLNDIAYGNAAYGAEAAARIYFRKDASQLDLAQAAMLAGLPQDPTLLNPLVHWQAARSRQLQVLEAMVRTHDITQDQADRAAAEDLSPPDQMFAPATLDRAPGFVSYVATELANRFGEHAVQQGGLHVVSSLDWNLQTLAQQAVSSTVSADRWRDLTDGALVAMDPRTGEVLAMVGSAGNNVPGGQYNMASGHPRNPGSSFKVFTYTAAIDSKRYTMTTPIVDAPLTVDMPGFSSYTPKNYDLGYHGTCPLQVCLGNSLNIPAVEVEVGTGVQNVVDEARKFGAPPYQQHGSSYASNDPASSFGPTLTLGGYAETPLQMATGVSVLAAEGVVHQPEAIVRATSTRGQQVYAASTRGNQVLDAGTAYIVSQMLSNPANRDMIFGASTPLALTGRHAAAKTGTTDNFTDAWTVGYTPSLATAVWMGNTSSAPMVEGSDGMFVAAPAWHQFMNAALDEMHKGDEWYQQPSDVTTQWANGGQAYFLTGTSPYQPTPSLPSWAHMGYGYGNHGSGDYGSGDYGSGSSGSGPTSGSDGGQGGPGCRSWTVGGASYWACTSGNSGLPGDPGGG